MDLNASSGQCPSEPVRALIFDMDGTMIDSMPYHTLGWIAFAQRHGVTLDTDDFMRRTTGRNFIECMREVFPQDLSMDRILELTAEKETLYRDLFRPVFSEVAGFKKFLQMALDQGLDAGVGTAADKHNIAFAFENLKLPRMPRVVVGGDEGLPGKPEPAIFLEAAKRMNVDASACIVFEDAPLGIEAARRAGMRAVAVCSSHTPEQLAGPHVVASVRNFLELIDSRFLETLHVATH